MREAVSDFLVDWAGEAPILSACSLAYSAEGKRLIDGLDLAIRPNRRTVVMGPNGAGKSLLLRLLHGLIRPDAGEVRWRGRPLDGAGRRAQAMVFQRPVMLRRSAFGNLTFALAVRGVGGRERTARASKALAMARLEELSRQPARVLSIGEQQRLAVARALVAGPELLFLDEPTASLDPASTAAIEALIDAAHRDGVTIVLVTHDLGQARRLGDDLVFVDRGRVVETGDAGRVLSAPRSVAARAWVEGRLHLDATVRSPNHNRNGRQT